MLYVHSEAVTNVPVTTQRLTDAAVRDDPVPVIALLPPWNLHNPIAAVTIVIRCIFHGLEWHQLEWKRLSQSFKTSLRGECCPPLLRVKIKPFCYLDREPSVEVFEIERSLVFAECESVICVEALHLLITVHNEDLNKGIKEAEQSISMPQSILHTSSVTGAFEFPAMTTRRTRLFPHRWYFGLSSGRIIIVWKIAESTTATLSRRPRQTPCALGSDHVQSLTCAQ